MDQDLGVRIDRPTSRVHEAVGVIGVHMGEDDVSDVGGIDSGRLEIGRQLAEGGLHRVAGAGIDEHRRAVTLEQEVVHRNEKRAIVCSADELLGGRPLHAEHEIERGLQAAVGEALHLEVAATKYPGHCHKIIPHAVVAHPRVLAIKSSWQ